MRSSHSLDRLETAFDDDRLVADAGLLLPATLAHHLGLKALVDEHLHLAAAGAANPGDKLLTLVMSALAGGDHPIDATIGDRPARGERRACPTARRIEHTYRPWKPLGRFVTYST